MILHHFQNGNCRRKTFNKVLRVIQFLCHACFTFSPCNTVTILRYRNKKILYIFGIYHIDSRGLFSSSQRIARRGGCFERVQTNLGHSTIFIYLYFIVRLSHCIRTQNRSYSDISRILSGLGSTCNNCYTYPTMYPLFVFLLLQHLHVSEMLLLQTIHMYHVNVWDVSQYYLCVKLLNNKNTLIFRLITIHTYTCFLFVIISWLPKK